MEWVGQIEARPDRALTESGWIACIAASPRLATLPPREGINPFTGKRHVFKANPTTARVLHRDDSTRIGMIEWAPDESRTLAVWAEPGWSTELCAIAQELAVQLGAVFARTETSAEQQ